MSWLHEEGEFLRMRVRKRSSRGSQRTARARNLVTIANNLYVRNDLEKCIDVLKEVICLVPRNPHPYFTLGLIFEEKNELPKAYYCFLVSAHLQKNNYGLWKKLYDYSRRLGYEKERIYFIEVLQRKGNKREMVLEKMSLYGDDIFKELSCKIELFEFDGVDDGIFEMIREKITHKARIGRLTKRLFNHLMKSEESCSNYYMEQLIILKYESSDLSNLRLIFDKYLLRRNVDLNMKLRVIYMMSIAHDHGDDSLESIHLFLDDEEMWSMMDEVETLKHLVDILIEKNIIDEAMRLLSRIRTRFHELNEFVYWKLGRISHEREEYEEAILYYKLVLEINPINDVVKAYIHSIYIKQGNVEMAKRYETITQLISIVGGGNRNEVYSPEMCMNMRVLYKNTKDLMNEPERFIESNQVLIDDFLRNRFIFERRKKKSGTSKISKQRIRENMLTSGVNEQEMNNEFKSIDLHGLSADEWFDVVMSQISSLLLIHNVEEATSLVFRSLEAYIFRHRSDMMSRLIFVGLKISLIFGEFGDFIALIRSAMCHSGNYSYSYLLFYFSHFFLSFHKNGDFSYFQKYLQRVCRRKLSIHEMDEESSSEDEFDSHYDHDMKDELRDRDGGLEDIPGRKITGISHFLFLNSFIPNMLQSKTVEMISSVQMDDGVSESIILASMFLIHSKSRRVSDRKLFIRKGISILKELKERSTGEDVYVVSYNIGKAYQFFGFPGFAESFYLEALNTSDIELKQLVKFNLYLIYKRNKTEHLLKDIIG